MGGSASTSGMETVLSMETGETGGCSSMFVCVSTGWTPVRIEDKGTRTVVPSAFFIRIVGSAIVPVVNVKKQGPHHSTQKRRSVHYTLKDLLPPAIYVRFVKIH